MMQTRRPGIRRGIAKLMRAASVLVLALAPLGAWADAATLRAKYAELREQLRSNPYQRPIHIDSADGGDTLRGDIFAVLDHPFDAISRSLRNPNDWCAILILPFNTKYCHPLQGGDGTKLLMRIGRKPDERMDDGYRLDLLLRPVAATPDYFESLLASREGPVGTHDYRITVEAVPLDGRRTFMHLGYSYSYGGMGRFAMQAYLATAGASKVGFTVAGRDARGQSIFTGGMRGAIERNVMRYYLAVDAHLAALSAPPERRRDKRIETWFDSTKRYARQLHEMDRAQYVALKRGEYERQQTLLE